ncbi:MAG: ribosomal protein [Dehalococcoidia bacterium]|nr:ribosomal protein [Dehalococcoidia bacterium]
MVRISGVDIPNNKRINISLSYIFGVGPAMSSKILSGSGVDPNTLTKDLTEEEIARIRDALDKDIMVEGDLRREVGLNIRRLTEISCYRGVRHRRGLPVHGQRTKTNARTKRGNRKTVAGRRRAAAKK